MGMFDIKNQVDEVLKEIMEYKWLESEKLGHDIGIARAAREWIEKHYDEWFKYNYRRFLNSH